MSSESFQPSLFPEEPQQETRQFLPMPRDANGHIIQSDEVEKRYDASAEGKLGNAVFRHRVEDKTKAVPETNGSDLADGAVEVPYVNPRTIGKSMIGEAKQVLGNKGQATPQPKRKSPFDVVPPEGMNFLHQPKQTPEA